MTDSTRDRVGIVALKNASAPMNASPAPCSKFTKHFEKKKKQQQPSVIEQQGKYTYIKLDDFVQLFLQYWFTFT